VESRQQAGERLRQAREAKGITLEEAQARTKVHIGILRSLEKGAVPDDINQVYLRGLIRIYANYLKADAATIIEEFDIGTPMTDQPATISKEEPPSSMPELASIIKLAAIIIATLLMMVLFFSLVKKIVRAVTVRRPAKIVEPVKIAAPAEKVENIPVAVEKPKSVSLAVQAKRNSWLHVKADGKTVFQGVFRRGSSETWVAKEKLDLSLGDAGAVELAINDKRIPPLGKRGEAIKNIKITKEGISVGDPR
jgi:transcriptional regulator with XRE-family HTH domain